VATAPNAERLRPVLIELRDLPSRAIAGELTKRAIRTPRRGDWQSTTAWFGASSCVDRRDRPGVRNRGREQFSTAPGACQLARRTPDIWIDDGTRITIVWDEPMPGVGRPWFECPVCGQRCRHVYLRA
jgi:hypothetical protein